MVWIFWFRISSISDFCETGVAQLGFINDKECIRRLKFRKGKSVIFSTLVDLKTVLMRNVSI